MTRLGFASEYFSKGKKKKKRGRWRKCGKILTLLNLDNRYYLGVTLFSLLLCIFQSVHEGQDCKDGELPRDRVPALMSEMDLARRHPGRLGWEPWIVESISERKESNSKKKRPSPMDNVMSCPPSASLTDELPPSHHSPFSWDPTPTSQGP